jgi:DNA-binding response OmpR family regulator
MDSKRVFLLERDRVEAGAVASLIEQCGYQVAGVAHSLEDAIKVQVEGVDFALLERDLGDGTDATPIAEILSAAGVPYAFIIRSGDRTDPTLFPGAAFLRKPLSALAIERALELSNDPASQRRGLSLEEAGIELLKSELQRSDQLGPPPAPNRADD